MNKKIFIVSSVSASGKTTLVKRIQSKFNLYRYKTCTTREKREGETENDYYFMSEDDFELNVLEDNFIEHATVFKKHYGLLKTEVENNLDKNCIVILDVQGEESFKKTHPNAVTIFILPPSKEILLKRLNERNSDQDEIDTRISEIDNEMKHVIDYKYTIEYGEIEDMMRSFENIIESEINR